MTKKEHSNPDGSGKLKLPDDFLGTVTAFLNTPAHGKAPNKVKPPKKAKRKAASKKGKAR